MFLAAFTRTGLDSIPTICKIACWIDSFTWYNPVYRNFLLYTTDCRVPTDKVSVSVGHPDHVKLTVHSLMELCGSPEGQGQRWEDRIDRLCPLQELLQLIHWADRQEVWSEDQGARKRSGLFHSWYTDPSLQSKTE